MRKPIPFIILMFLCSLSSAQIVPDYFISFYDTASTGYYFTTPRNTGVPPQLVQSYALILDGKGDVVYVKEHPMGYAVSDFKIQPNGLMSYAYGSKFYLMDSTFTVVDTLTTQNGVPIDLHDFNILSNGHFLMLGNENLTLDLSGYSIFGPNNNLPGSTTASVSAAVIQELDVNKNVVFEWHAIDHFSFTDVDPAWLGNPAVIDWTHSNSLCQDIDGNFILSSRHFNEITKISRNDSSVIWRLGGNANQFTFLNDSMQFRRQHFARRNSNGNLTLFDNGDGANSTPFHFAAAKEYILDEANLTAFLNTSIVDDSSGYSTAMGNFQHNPNGNSVISYGLSSNYHKLMNTYTSSGQKVFQLEFIDFLISYRSFNYQTLPFALNRPQLNCYQNGNSWYLDAGTGYSQYLWSNGDSTQIIEITDTGSYYVFVPFGQGGYITSEYMIVNDLTNPCNSSSLNEIHSVNLSVSPNPTTGLIVVSGAFAAGSYKEPIEIFDLSGKLMKQVYTSSELRQVIDISDFKKGMYILRFMGESKKVVRY